MPERRPASKRLTREERAHATYQRLMDAAARIVGDRGYAATSVARVTDEAGVAHGTFYNYFADRQELFDALLPYVGRQITDRITEDLRDVGSGLEREMARFRSYCAYLLANPGFYRILYEAEVFAPKAHAEHVQRLHQGYRRALDRAVAAGDIAGFGDEELDAIVSILMGARAYVAMAFIKDGKSPDAAIRAYHMLLSRGLFGPAGAALSPAAPTGDNPPDPEG